LFSSLDTCDLTECPVGEKAEDKPKTEQKEDTCGKDLQEIYWNNQYIDRGVRRLRGLTRIVGEKRNRFLENYRPKYTRLIFEMMTRVLQGFCPASFVPPNWI
jgi:hypothetical protein